MNAGWIVGGALSAAWLLWSRSPAAGDCVSECQASTYCDSEMNATGECSRRLNDCYVNECNRTRYGAIAYDAQSGAYGWSNDWDDGPSAEQAALSSCQESGSGCQVVLDFWNKCGALAANDSGQYDSGLGDSRGEAEANAVAACGPGCDVRVWACSN